MTVNEAEAVMLAAARGVGITQTMDLLAARELVDGNLVIVLPEHTAPGAAALHRPHARPRNAWRGCGSFPTSCAASASTWCSARRPIPACGHRPSSAGASISSLMTAREAHTDSDGWQGLLPGRAITSR